MMCVIFFSKNGGGGCGRTYDDEIKCRPRVVVVVYKRIYVCLLCTS